MSESELRGLRRARGWSQADLAKRVGLSRQGYAAIESGSARPSVDVALRLAAVLNSSVEALFQRPFAAAGRVSAELASASGAVDLPAPVRLAEIGGRLIAYPASHHRQDMRLADGVATAEGKGRVRVDLFPDRGRAPDLVVIGCDPAFALVADRLRRDKATEVLWVQAGSGAALAALERGEAHVAGVHLRDPETGVYNAPLAVRSLPAGAALVRFAVWEQTLLTAAGNPLGIRSAADLARGDLRFVNRERGSGSRALFDRWLDDQGVDGAAIPGYGTTRASGHLEVAAAVASGAADAGVGIRAAGILFGLHALPLASEPYDLVVPRALLDAPAVRVLVDVLREPALARQVEALGGYDASDMGRAT